MNKSENLEDCITQELQAFHSNIFETHGDISWKNNNLFTNLEGLEDFLSSSDLQLLTYVSQSWSHWVPMLCSILPDPLSENIPQK